MVKKIRSEDTPEYNTEERKRIREQTIINILGQDRYNEIQHQKTKLMETTKKVSNEGMTPVLLAGVVKSVLMTKPYQFKNFKSFSEGMGDDYLLFVNECKKQLKSATKRRISDLKKEIKKLETGLEVPKK